MNGNLIGAVNTPTLASAPGVWDIEELKLAQQQNTWPPLRLSDPDFEYVSLLLSGETAAINGAQNNTFQDSSTNNFTITRNGNTTQGSFSPYLPNWSNYFDGSGDYINNTSNALITQSVSTFTVEAWIYMTAAPTSDTSNVSGLMTLDGQPTGAINYLSFGPLSSRVLYLRWFDGAAKNAIGSTTLNLNQWYHIACVANSNAVQFYVNGVAETMSGTTTLTNRPGTASNFALGLNYYGAFIGYISNARVSSTALYTSNFTPPTAPLTAIAGTSLLTCQSNRFIDNSTNNFTITRNGDTRITPFSPFSSFVATKGYVPATYGGTGYFDGTGDYLTVATSSNMSMGTGDLTFECWIYATAANDSPVYECRSTNSTTDGFTVTAFSPTVIRVYTSAVLVTATIPNYLNTWVHFAYTRSGSTNRLFINGILQNTVTASDNFTNQVAIIGGGRYASSSITNFFTGYISNARVVKGTAVYTSNFTPPTAPLTAISGTSLLTNFTNGGVIDSAALNVAETGGNAQVSTSVKKYGSGSYYFDGTGDYLVIPNNVLSQFGSGSLTWEMWINTTSSTQYATLYSRTPSSFSTGMWALMVNIASNSAGDVGVFMADYSGGAPLLQTTGVNIRDGNWHHVAVVRNGSSWVLYVDGTSRATQTWSGTIATITATPYVGADQFYGRNYLGYISDLRLTNGLARYTANFTPPIASLPQF